MIPDGVAHWSDLEREIALWRAVGEAPTFWWRDDDTQAPTPELERLIELSERFDAPLHLAVIPAGVSPDLAARLRASPNVWAMQHGFQHKNHEPAGMRASEVGVSRDLGEQRADLARGWRLLQEAELPNLLPCVVPPWNRMADATRHALPSMGFAMLSAFEGPTGNTPVEGLVQIHSHFDPIKWKEGARFRGVEKTLAIVLQHLVDRRTGRVPKTTHTGLLTHHLFTDDATWDFVEEFCDRVAQAGAGGWMPVAPMINSN